MTTTIRGKSGKDSLRELLDQHDECLSTMDSLRSFHEPLFVVDKDSDSSWGIRVSRDEVTSILQSRLQAINTKLENLGLKIGDEVAESAQ